MPEKKPVGVLPSRYGAQRFPGKPLALIAGVPMIGRVVRQALKAKALSAVVVATDDARIARVAERYGAEAVMTPPELPSNRPGGLRGALARRPFFVNIQGVSPVIISPSLIDAAAKALVTRKESPHVHGRGAVGGEKDWKDPNVFKAVLALNGTPLLLRAPIPHSRKAGCPALYTPGNLRYRRTGCCGWRNSNRLPSS
jgi:3-deoxy-manno-octulosonate cytidylyltransferase (CMP-KDO synthetase)